MSRTSLAYLIETATSPFIQQFLPGRHSLEDPDIFSDRVRLWFVVCFAIQNDKPKFPIRLHSPVKTLSQDFFTSNSRDTFLCHGVGHWTPMIILCRIFFSCADSPEKNSTPDEYSESDSA